MRKLLLTLFAVFTANVAFGQTNLLTNGSFEEWTDGVPTGWMIAKSGENTAGSNVAVAQSTDAQAGTYAAALTNSTAGNSKPSNGRIASSEIKLKAGTYTYTIYVKAADETGAAARIGYVPIDATTGKVGSYAYGNNENGLSAPDTLTTTWLKKTQEFTLTETKTICLLVMHSKNYADKTVIIDNASLTTTDGGISDGTDEEEEEDGDAFEAPLTDAQGNWTFEDMTIPDELSYIWAQSTSYGMKASAYANGTKYVTESYLVSPAIILGESSVLTFDHVQRYAAEDPASQLTLWIREDGTTNWAAQLTIPTYSDGSNWTFVPSGDIDLATYAGKTIQLGFRYSSDENAAATWEIKNVKVTNAKAAEDTPELKDPTNTPETAYTTAEAVEIVKNKDQYDMSKEVYVKGTISKVGVEDKEGNLTDLPGNEYGNATYFITDGTVELEVYRGYYYNGDKFTAEDQIKVGDNVIIFGQLTQYKETYELAKGNYIYSLNGVTPVQGIAAQTEKAQVIYNLAGQRIEKAVKGIYIINGKKVLK